MTMAEVVIFGFVASDVVLQVPALPVAGQQVAGEGLGWRVGGSSANVACGLSSAGHRVRLVGPVGSDAMGDELVAELRRNGVDTTNVFRMPGPSPRALILLDGRGERAIIGLDGHTANWRSLPERMPDLATADCVYVESYSRFPVTVSDRAPSALLVTSPAPEGATTWPADVVVGSVTQYGTAVVDNPFHAVRASAGIRLQWVVVTRGEHGADAYAADDHVHVPARPVTQVDTTGAGDAFAAGLVHGLLDGANIAAAVDIAAAWGAAAVGRLQSLPPTWAEVLAAQA